MRRGGYLSKGVVGYLVLALGMVVAQGVAFNARSETRRQACKAVVADRELLRDVVNVAIPPLTAQQPPLDPTLPASVRQLILDSRLRSRVIRGRIERRLARSLELCNGTGVDEVVHLGALPTTTSSSSTSSTPSAVPHRTGTSTARPPAPHRTTTSSTGPPPPTSTVVKPPATTTTTSCRRLIPAVGPCTP